MPFSTSGGRIIKAYELSLKVTEDGKLSLPAEVAVELPKGEGLRVIILVPEGENSQVDDEAWRRVTIGQFFAGYSKDDPAYDST